MKSTLWIRGVMLAASASLGLLMAGQAFADVSAQSEMGPADTGFSTTVCDTRGGVATAYNCNSLLGAGTHVRGFKLINRSANSECALYDLASVAALKDESSTPRDELSEATAAESNLHMYPLPMKFTTAVSVAMTGADTTCIIYH